MAQDPDGIKAVIDAAQAATPESITISRQAIWAAFYFFLVGSGYAINKAQGFLVRLAALKLGASPPETAESIQVLVKRDLYDLREEINQRNTDMEGRLGAGIEGLRERLDRHIDLSNERREKRD